LRKFLRELSRPLRLCGEDTLLLTAEAQSKQSRAQRKSLILNRAKYSKDRIDRISKGLTGCFNTNPVNPVGFFLGLFNQ
jgi:hypothetical protein